MPDRGPRCLHLSGKLYCMSVAAASVPAEPFAVRTSVWLCGCSSFGGARFGFGSTASSGLSGGVPGSSDSASLIDGARSGSGSAASSGAFEGVPGSSASAALVDGPRLGSGTAAYWAYAATAAVNRPAAKRVMSLLLIVMVSSSCSNRNGCCLRDWRFGGAHRRGGTDGRPPDGDESREPRPGRRN